MAPGVSPTERIRAEIDALFAADRDLASILEDVGRLSVRLVMQAALEAEVTEFLGRARYQRHEAAVESRPGARNGWQPPTAIKTTMARSRCSGKAARHRRAVLLAAVRAGRDQGQRAGIAGHLRLGAGPVGS